MDLKKKYTDTRVKYLKPKFKCTCCDVNPYYLPWMFIFYFEYLKPLVLYLYRKDLVHPPFSQFIYSWVVLSKHSETHIQLENKMCSFASVSPIKFWSVSMLRIEIWDLIFTFDLVFAIEMRFWQCFNELPVVCIPRILCFIDLIFVCHSNSNWADIVNLSFSVFIFTGKILMLHGIQLTIGREARITLDFDTILVGVLYIRLNIWIHLLQVFLAFWIKICWILGQRIEGMLTSKAIYGFYCYFDVFSKSDSLGTFSTPF